MNIELSKKEYRLLLDLVYVGNWVMNSTRGIDRFEEYDVIQAKLFSHCEKNGLGALVKHHGRIDYPSQQYEDGGIHEVIADYEDAVFFEILAEELARRDMNFQEINHENITELAMRIEEYISEFEQNGVENISIDM